MTNSDIYFLDLIKKNLLEVDLESGIVYSSLSGKRKAVGAKQSAGYLHISAGPTRQQRNYILLHRLIWLVANGDIPNGYEVNHKNGDKHDNQLSNLELVTRAENVKHAIGKLGKTFGFMSSPHIGRGKKTSHEKISEVLSLFDNGQKNQSEISRLTGIKRPIVNRILHKHRL